MYFNINKVGEYKEMEISEDNTIITTSLLDKKQCIEYAQTLLFAADELLDKYGNTKTKSQIDEIARSL